MLLKKKKRRMRALRLGPWIETMQCGKIYMI